MAADAVDVCNPTSDNGCVNGILQDADKKAIAGITVKLSGTEEAETTTDADGKWAFSVKDDGDYTDESVAEEHGLKSSSATVTIKKASFDKQRGVVRFDQVNDSASSGSSSSDSAKSGSDSSSSSGTATVSKKKAGSNIGKRIWQQLYSGIIFGLMLGHRSHPKRNRMGPAAPPPCRHHAADDRHHRPVDGIAIHVPVLLRR